MDKFHKTHVLFRWLARKHRLSLLVLCLFFLCMRERGHAIQVDWIGRTCATFYGVIIPCFLAFLFAKQHVTMRQSKMFLVHAHRVHEEVTLQLQGNEACLKDRHCSPVEHSWS